MLFFMSVKCIYTKNFRLHKSSKEISRDQAVRGGDQLCGCGHLRLSTCKQSYYCTLYAYEIKMVTTCTCRMNVQQHVLLLCHNLELHLQIHYIIFIVN
jgi:hypothetical protein